LHIETDPRVLRASLVRYQRPSHRRSIFEIAVTFVPLAALWGLAFFTVSKGWWWGMVFTLPAAAFMVRLFMIQHDCGHAAFFRNTAANTWVGRVIGVLTMTPYGYWRRTHAIHHATSGNLDRRWLGAVETLTVEEYRALPWIKRLGYRLYRNPAVMFGLGPAYMFLLQQRLPIGLMKEADAWISVMGANIALAVLTAPLIMLGGLASFAAVHGTVVVLAASIGIWLFYVQHQFEGAYWARNEDWSLAEASLRGSSHLDLPPVLRWFTANIGAHHLHHVSSKIPFYRVSQVLKDLPHLGEVNRVTLGDSVRAVRLALWDEAAGRLVSFRDAKRSTAAA
jgi:omega-6 fatty acid desaturase (delta-12 desaturase)